MRAIESVPFPSPPHHVVQADAGEVGKEVIPCTKGGIESDPFQPPLLQRMRVTAMAPPSTPTREEGEHHQILQHSLKRDAARRPRLDSASCCGCRGATRRCGVQNGGGPLPGGRRFPAIASVVCLRIAHTPRCCCCRWWIAFLLSILVARVLLLDAGRGILPSIAATTTAAIPVLHVHHLGIIGLVIFAAAGIRRGTCR